MTVYRTCFGCKLQKQHCVRREAIRSTITGLGITSVRIKCPDRQKWFETGQRVTVELIIDDDYDRSEQHTFKGTVVSEAKEKTGKYVVNLDHGPSLTDEEIKCPDALRGNGFIKVSHSRLSKLNEPDRKVCEICAKTAEQGYLQCEYSGFFTDDAWECLERTPELAEAE